MRWTITFKIETPQTFDRDAVIQVLESERGRDISPIVRAAARWAVDTVQHTESVSVKVERMEDA